MTRHPPAATRHPCSPAGTPPTRRAARRLTLVAVGALLLAACADGTANAPTATTGAAPGPTETAAAGETSAAGEGTAAGQTTAGAAGDTTAASAPAATTGAAGSGSPTASFPAGTTVTLVAYDSFPESGTPLNDALADFTATTGIEVELLRAGDTGTMLSKAELTAGNPEGDVMWGVDNTYLSRAVDAGIFDPYSSPGRDELRPDLLELVPDDQVTPVDFGDVCVNYDIGWFDEAGLTPPTSLQDLADPAYADLLVTENPATSSPGLAFLLATIDELGEDGWQDYWSALADNGVEVVDGWTEAYYSRFSWAGGGPKPLVVSYGSSPPAEVIFANPPREDAPTGVLESTCFRQVEFAGVLRGTDQSAAARALVDFLISDRFQSELPLNLFVYPADRATELPPEFVEYAVIPDQPRSLDPATIDARREAWIDEWTSLVLG